MMVLPVRREGTASGTGGTADHLHPPLKGVLALRPEVVDVGLEVELEDVVLMDVLRLRGHSDRVPQQREAG